MPEGAERHARAKDNSTVLAFDFGLKRIGVAVGEAELGTAHPLAKRVERFARRLEGRFHIPVARVDERFSSVEAESRLRGVKRTSIDSVAAQLLLQQYFDEAA